jgi:RND family efflux transporter MFP subunit
MTQQQAVEAGRGLRPWVGLLAAAALLQACARAEGDAAQVADSTQPADSAGRVVNVEVTRVVPTEFTEVIRVTGEVEALFDVTVAAEEPGRVEAFLVEKGGWVERGQPVAQLERDLLQAQVDEARASAALAREQYERQRQLWEQDRIGTEIAFLRARYEAEMAAARQAQLEERLARTVIRAPVAGVFDEKFLEEGEMAMAGAPVARIVSSSRLKITAGVPERFARSVRVGNPARIWFDVFPGRDFTGRIGFVGSRVDPGNRTFPIEILMDNAGRIVKPHMVANVEVQHERLERVIVVSQEVVQRSAEGYKVFVAVEEEGRAVAAARAVKLGPTSGNRTVITEGLAIGDLLITLGHRQVDDGSRIRVVNDVPSRISEGQ